MLNEDFSAGCAQCQRAGSSSSTLLSTAMWGCSPRGSGPASKTAWQQLSTKHISDLILPKWNLKAKRNYLHVCFKQIMFKPALWHRTQSCRVLIQVNKTSPWLRVSRAKRSTEYHTPVQYKLWSSACCATYLAYKFSCCTNPTQLFPWYHSNIFIASRLHVPKHLSHPYLCQAGCIARAAVQPFLSCIAAAQLQPKPWFHLPN